VTEPIADIAVNAPLRQLFSYRLNAGQASLAKAGMRVRVPFGRRTAVGVIVRIHDGDGRDLKEVRELLDTDLLLPESLLKLLRWAADYYLHPLGQVIRSALPAGLGSDKRTPAILTEAVYRAVDQDPVLRGQKQKELFAFICEHGPLPLTAIREHFADPHAALKRLVELGCLESYDQERIRDPFLSDAVAADRPPLLNTAQQAAVDQIVAALDPHRFQGFLVHGVTGSGKTEVYLHAVSQCLALQRQALILVPEISLTPQLVSRFRARFETDGVAIVALHSGMSDGERYDAWRRISRNQVQIVIGARSAIFAPLQDLGLIIVDEEHDSSYKQGEGFRYNARDLALVRGQQQGCAVVLGSATPSLASYYRSRQNGLTLLSLPGRVHSGTLPQVTLIDLKEEDPGEGTLAPTLIEAIQGALEVREQVLLLLNRRGFSPFLLCPDCGSSFHCPNCDITLTYHQRDHQLRCHYCDYADAVPALCPQCRGGNLQPQGAGTERLEQELAELFPGARISRMDRDTTSRKGAHQRIIREMMAGEIDILVGTQMIAKGHDFPGVSVVGVLGADSVLNFPDFRAAERSFALLTQVAGRAGREKGGGQVYIQSFNPEHYALTCAASQDYLDFYQQELPFREELGYPPCGHLVNLVVSGNFSRQVKETADDLGHFLLKQAAEVEILGPSPCPLPRLRGKSRHQVLLKAGQRGILHRLLSVLEDFQKRLPRQVTLAIDVDPVDML